MSLLLILIASLLGSPHCGAMCGGFVALSGQSEQPIKSQSAYHVGRLITYVLLGIAAGSFGEILNQGGDRLGIFNFATVVTAILLIGGGVGMLFGKSVGIQNFIPLNCINTLRQKFIPGRSHKYLFPLCLGLFSTLLPCGWLYTYVVVAAGTASPFSAGSVMAVFWLGTLPLLISVGSITNLISSPLKKYVPVVTSILMISAGIYSLAAHNGWISMPMATLMGDHCEMHSNP